MKIMDGLKDKYDVVITYLGKQDINNIVRILGNIWRTCKIAKGNNTCLGDCLNCEFLREIIKQEIDNKKELDK